MKLDRQEVINGATHGAGVLAGVLGGSWLIVGAAVQRDVRLIIGVSVFVATLVLLYTASTLYHLAVASPTKARLKIMDHASIYLLIAGTYTPFMLAGLRGGWGWSLFGVVWGLAGAGIVFKLFFIGRFQRISTAIYVAMGWLVLIAAVPMMHTLTTVTLSWLVAGGVTYTAGVIFYHSKRPYAHGVWHLFVLGGSICHAMAVATLMF